MCLYFMIQLGSAAPQKHIWKSTNDKLAILIRTHTTREQSMSSRKAKKNK